MKTWWTLLLSLTPPISHFLPFYSGEIIILNFMFIMSLTFPYTLSIFISKQIYCLSFVVKNFNSASHFLPFYSGKLILLNFMFIMFWTFPYTLSICASKQIYCLSFIVKIFKLFKSLRNYFFFLNFISLFIFGCVGFSFLCGGSIQLRQVGATLHCSARASHCRGLSCCGAQAPDAQAQ